MKFYQYALVLLVSLAACTGQPESETSHLRPVSIQLSWVHEYSSAPFYTAVHDGYFAAEGLEANLLVGGFGEQGYIDPIQEVVDGTVDFGMSSGPSLIEARANGADVVAIANLMQRSPLALMTLNPDIQQPQDFIGKSILVADGGARHGLESFLALQSIPLDSVTIIPRTDFGVTPLVNGEVDALVAWVINEGVTLREQGLEPRIFLMSDYGVENYDFVLMTSQRTVDENPELVQKVVNAVHLGLDKVSNDAAHAIDDVLIYAPELDHDAQLLRLETMIPLMKIDGQHDMSMSPDVWAFSFSLLVERNIVPSDFDVTTVYTTQFAEASSDLDK
jgi:NitT/TauT family transport system substrate-binding protein